MTNNTALDGAPTLLAEQAINNVSTQEQLDSAQKNLLKALDSLTSNPSIFSRVSLYWQQRPWWQKLILGGLIGLPLLLGLSTQIISLAILGLSLVAVFGFSWFLMNDHSQQYQVERDEVRTNALNFVNLLGTIVESFECINKQLETQISSLNENNKFLTNKCNELDQETKLLKETILSLEQNQTEFLKIQHQLQMTISSADNMVIEQSKLLQKKQAILDETTLAYQQTQTELADAVRELEEVKQNLGAEILRAKKINETLNNTVQTLTTLSLADQKLRSQCLEKFSSSINNQETRLSTLITNLTKSGQQLIEAVEGMSYNNQRFTTLLDLNEQHLGRLTKLAPSPIVKNGHNPHRFHTPGIANKASDLSTNTSEVTLLTV